MAYLRQTYVLARCPRLGDLSTVAQTIQQIEGWFPGSVSYRNNNPGNLKYAGQPGAIGQDAAGFAIFSSYDAGLQALNNQITLDASRGESISDFTAKYAPAADQNNPTSYAAQIASATGLSVSDPLSAALSDSGDLSNFDVASLFDGSTSSIDPLTLGVLITAGVLVLWAITS